MVNVTSIILGGGRGERLYPLTLERAKPAVGFAGKYRLIDIPISNCLNSGLYRIFVLTQFLSASLHRHIMQTYRFGPFTEGFVDILAAEQTPQRSDWFQGTADAVRATLKHTTYYPSEQMLILSGDHLYRMNYADLILFHREQRADITLCVYPVSSDDARRMGLLRLGAGGVVEEFVEKPQDEAIIERFQAPLDIFSSRGIKMSPERCLASMGVYVFETKVLLDLLSRSEQADFGKEIIPSSIGKLRILAYPFAKYWRDIGTVSALFAANLEITKPDSPFPLYAPRWPLYTRRRFLAPTRVVSSKIGNSILADGSTIEGARISDSIVGMRSVVRENTLLREVVMLGADFYEGEEILSEPRETDLPPLGIGRGCEIERAIIDKNARIGDGVVIRPKPEIQDFRSDTYWVRDGITVIPKGAVIPPGTVL